MTPDPLRLRYDELAREARENELELDERKSKLLRAAEKRIERETKAERDALIKLRRRVYAAKCAWEDAVIEVSRKDPRVGQLLIGWTSSRYYGGGWSPNGQQGRIDVWTRESKHPENTTYGLPSPGDLFVRVLKKDGTDSLNFDKLGHSWKAQWLPPGEVPAGYKPPPRRVPEPPGGTSTK